MRLEIRIPETSNTTNKKGRLIVNGIIRQLLNTDYKAKFQESNAHC